jgi:Arc/MetJ-type ribon-helix-helix transcriptional regulator
MTITKITPVRLSEPDKAMLAELAARLGKNQSAVIRALIRDRLAILREQDPQAEAQTREHTESEFTQKWRQTV